MKSLFLFDKQKESSSCRSHERDERVSLYKLNSFLSQSLKNQEIMIKLFEQNIERRKR